MPITEYSKRVIGRLASIAKTSLGTGDKGEQDAAPAAKAWDGTDSQAGRQAAAACGYGCTVEVGGQGRP